MTSQENKAAARLTAPYVQAIPRPASRVVAFDLAETTEGSSGLLDVHECLLRATASGELALEDARNISSMLKTHRRLVETVDLEQRIQRLEQESQMNRNAARIVGLEAAKPLHTLNGAVRFIRETPVDDAALADAGRKAEAEGKWLIVRRIL